MGHTRNHELQHKQQHRHRDKKQLTEASQIVKHEDNCSCLGCLPDLSVHAEGQQIDAAVTVAPPQDQMQQYWTIAMVVKQPIDNSQMSQQQAAGKKSSACAQRLQHWLQVAPMGLMLFEDMACK